MSEHDNYDYHGAEGAHAEAQRRGEKSERHNVEDAASPDGFTRRRMLKLLMGAPAALALGVPGCERKPRRKIVSRPTGPEYQKPGKPLYYSSTWTEGPYPYGMTIKTVDGRPIKIEGNPDDPVGRGASTAAMQASILSLYDPDRLGSPRRGDQAVSWEEADEQIVTALRKASSVALVTRSTLGPAERAMVGKFVEVCPNARHFVHETVHDAPRRAAWKKVYGADGEVLPRFDRAQVIVSMDSDFLGTDGAVLENIRTFAHGRRLDDRTHGEASISRLYQIEASITVTGSNADERIRLRPSAMGAAVVAIRNALAEKHGPELGPLEAIVKDLAANRGGALVVAGPQLPQSVHAAVALLNDDLGAPGKTLEWNPAPATLPVTDPAEFDAAFDVLICLGVNLRYEPELGSVGMTIGHGLYPDETLSASTIALPSSHNLESWNDAEPRPGLRTLCQPVIAPLFDSRQEAESLLVWTQALAGEADPIRKLEDWHDYVRQQWQKRLVPDGTANLGPARNRAWESALSAGGEFKSKPQPSAFPSADRGAAEQIAGQSREAGDFELVILPHHAVHDGRFANQAWLQELPDPVSKVVWDNFAAVSPQTAGKLGAKEGDLVTVAVGDGSAELPMLIQPGMADGVVAATLGHGRTQGGHVAREAGGVNVAPLLGREDRSAPRVAFAATVSKAAGSHKLVRTQKQFSMHDRPIVLDGGLDEYRAEADFVKHKRHLPKPADLYEPYDYSQGHKWAMAIDLGACVGCGACVTACQAENNIPIVGRDQCGLGREMHWIRIDRYHGGDPDNPTVHSQPMLCQHCDHAPCENVCPVNATTHSAEGLNEMTYNRCVGTRYCANNCPYKVRRFNFLRYTEAQLRDSVQELAYNPQVTVRGVGVMEKCTFCVQRINAAKFAALNKGESVPDGALQTACQQACPAGAIVFGDANDPESRLAKLRASQRAYHVLEELNVGPNVPYLARVRNPGSHGKPDHKSAGGHHG